MNQTQTLKVNIGDEVMLDELPHSSVTELTAGRSYTVVDLYEYGDRNDIIGFVIQDDSGKKRNLMSQYFSRMCSGISE